MACRQHAKQWLSNLRCRSISMAVALGAFVAASDKPWRTDLGRKPSLQMKHHREKWLIGSSCNLAGFKSIKKAMPVHTTGDNAVLDVELLETKFPCLKKLPGFTENNRHIEISVCRTMYNSIWNPVWWGRGSYLVERELWLPRKLTPVGCSIQQ